MASSLTRSIMPLELTGIRIAFFAATITESCSISEMSVVEVLHPCNAKLFDSVPPLVKTTLELPAPTALDITVRAAERLFLISRPCLWTEEGFPTRDIDLFMAFTTDGRKGALAL